MRTIKNHRLVTKENARRFVAVDQWHNSNGTRYTKVQIMEGDAVISREARSDVTDGETPALRLQYQSVQRVYHDLTGKYPSHPAPTIEWLAKACLRIPLPAEV